jgi:cell division protein FtsI (penicillin-binding protein 3)
LNVEKEMLVEQKVDLNKMTSQRKSKCKKIQCQIGRMIGKNVIPQLENLGYRVDYKGVGKIKNNFQQKAQSLEKPKNLFESSKLKIKAKAYIYDFKNLLQRIQF